jgi:uncharacterized membrane protein YsdA (DUF1294 family)
MSETFKCSQCGRNFILSYSEQRYYRERGWTLPQRCDLCRAQRRQSQETRPPDFRAKPARPGLNGKHSQPELHRPPQELFTPEMERISLPRPSAEPRHSRPPGPNPYYRFGFLSLGLALFLMIIIIGFYGLSRSVISLAWLLAINLVTLLVYRYDKLVAGRGYTRVPEAVLLGLALLGGSLMAYIAMYRLRPRHKTQSSSFLLSFWAIVALQIIGLILYFGY